VFSTFFQLNTSKMYYSATRNTLCVLFIGVNKPGALINLFNAVAIEIIELLSIAVISYSAWFWCNH